MRLVRLASLRLDRAVDLSAPQWNVRTPDGTEVQFWRVTERPETVLMMAAYVDLSTSPVITESYLLEFPENERRRAEGALEQVANLVAISCGSGRRLWSPIPEFALADTTASERALFAKCRGFALPETSRFRRPQAIDLVAAAGALSDRPDGAALMSEGLSQVTAAGGFREFLRVFERAFKLGPGGVIAPLANFLRHFRALDFTCDEISHWLSYIRPRLTHADRRHDFAIEADVAPLIQRVELASLDVLLNKHNWRSPDSSRRAVWTPTGGVLRDGRSSIWIGGVQASLEATQILDRTSSYPVDLSLHFEIPEDWWTDTPPDRTVRRSFTSVVVQDLTESLDEQPTNTYTGSVSAAGPREP